MADDFENKRQKTNATFHSMRDYVMGALWFCLGGFVLLRKQFNANLDLDPTLLTIFGIAAVMYGLFRLYRGYKKNY